MAKLSTILCNSLEYNRWYLGSFQNSILYLCNDHEISCTICIINSAMILHCAFLLVPVAKFLKYLFLLAHSSQLASTWCLKAVRITLLLNWRNRSANCEISQWSWSNNIHLCAWSCRYVFFYVFFFELSPHSSISWEMSTLRLCWSSIVDLSRISLTKPVLNEFSIFFLQTEP